jgi:hypothetical protein
MTKFFISTLALFACAAPVFADKATPVTFSRNGETYQYISTEKNGVQYIDGSILTTGETFTFKVAHGIVTGDVAGRDVHFSVAETKKRDRLAAR